MSNYDSCNTKVSVELEENLNIYTLSIFPTKRKASSRVVLVKAKKKKAKCRNKEMHIALANKMAKRIY